MVDPAHSYIDKVMTNLFSFPFIVLSQLFLFPMLLAIMVGVWIGSKDWIQHPDQYKTLLLRTSIIGITLSVLGAIPLALYGVQVWDPSRVH